MTTRRNFIAATAAAPLALAIPSTAEAMADRTEWEAAMRRVREADAAYDAYVRNVLQPIEDALEEHLRSNGITKDAPRYLERRRVVVDQSHDYHAAHDEAQRLCDVFVDAEEALLKMPAPDAEALRWKLDRVLERTGDSTPAWSWGYVEQTVADYRRLLA